MRLAIISDIHDNLGNLRSVLAAAAGTDALICCGDLCSPFVAKAMGEGYAGPIHVVFGNNDGDLFRITQISAAFSQVTLHGEQAELEIDGRRIAVNHFDSIARPLADGDRYDLVCFGHNHRFEISNAGETLLLNPGEIFGGLSGSATWAVYDTQTGTASRRDV